MIETPTRNRVILIAAFHLLIAATLAFVLNIWVDEASTLYTTEKGIWSAMSNALADEKQAPLYFWLLALWRELGKSIFFARLFSIMCSVVAIFVFARVARRLFSEGQTQFLTLLFALHPFLIWASVEIRVYSAVVMLSLILLDRWHAYFFDSEPDRTSSAIRFLGLTVIALYTNYYLGFVLAGLFAALMITRRWRAAATYLGVMLVAGLLFAPLIFAVKAQFAANTVAFQTDRSPIVGLQLIWNTFLTFLAPTEIFPLEAISVMSLARVWAVRFGILIAIGLMIRKRRELLDDRILAYGAVTATITAFFLIAYFALGEVYVAIRHAAILFAPLLLLAAIVIVRIVPDRIWPAVLIVYLGLFSYSLYTLYPNAAKRGDWVRVGAFLEQNEEPGQPIIVFTTFDALALPYHYRGRNQIFPDERFFDFEIEAPTGTPEAWRKQTEFIISEIPRDATEIWLLSNEKCDIKQSCEPLEKFVEANYTVVLERTFYLEKVRLLRKKQ